MNSFNQSECSLSQFRVVTLPHTEKLPNLMQLVFGTKLYTFSRLLKINYLSLFQLHDSTPDVKGLDDERQSKLPQKLISNSELAMGMEEEEHLERENAQRFLKSLKEELKYLTSARGTIDIDQRLQEFASKFCHGSNVVEINRVYFVKWANPGLFLFILILFLTSKGQI